MTAFGIDFGTTNSAVAVMHGGEVEVIRIDTPPVEWEQFGYDRVFPTVFGYGENREPLFGWAAKQAETDTKIEAVKRLFATEDHVPIGNEQFLVDEIATMLFAQLKRSAAAESGHEMSKAVVTIPANSRGRARQRTKECAGMGGIDVLTLMNEPTAAAMTQSGGSNSNGHRLGRGNARRNSPGGHRRHLHGAVLCRDSAVRRSRL